MPEMPNENSPPPRPAGVQFVRWAIAAWVVVFVGALVWNFAARAETPTQARAEAAKITIDVRDAWTRATPGGATTAAVYLSISNDGKAAATLTAVESPNAEHAMVHTTTVTNGTAQMAMTPSLAIPPTSTVTLGPNGKHIMLEGLKAPLRQGDSFIITLTFAKAGKMSATVSVLAVGATGPQAVR